MREGKAVRTSGLSRKPGRVWSVRESGNSEPLSQEPDRTATHM